MTARHVVIVSAVRVTPSIALHWVNPGCQCREIDNSKLTAGRRLLVNSSHLPCHCMARPDRLLSVYHHHHHHQDTCSVVVTSHHTSQTDQAAVSSSDTSITQHDRHRRNVLLATRPLTKTDTTSIHSYIHVYVTWLTAPRHNRLVYGDRWAPSSGSTPTVTWYNNRRQLSALTNTRPAGETDRQTPSTPHCMTLNWRLHRQLLMILRLNYLDVDNQYTTRTHQQMR